MRITGYLLDTNIAIALLANDPQVINFVRQLFRDQMPLYFSVITESEVFTGLKEDEAPRATLMFHPHRCIHVTSSIARGAASIRKEQRNKRGRKVKTPDALIIATAMDHQYALVSRDSDMNFVHDEYGIMHIVI